MNIQLCSHTEHLFRQFNIWALVWTVLYTCFWSGLVCITCLAGLVWSEFYCYALSIFGLVWSGLFFYTLPTALDPIVVVRMAKDVSLTPRDNNYTYLKGRLMEVYDLTDDQKADRLLDLEIGSLPNSVHTFRVLQSKRCPSETHFPAPATRRCPCTGSSAWGWEPNCIGSQGWHHRGC